MIPFQAIGDGRKYHEFVERIKLISRLTFGFKRVFLGYSLFETWEEKLVPRMTHLEEAELPHLGFKSQNLLYLKDYPRFP